MFNLIVTIIAIALVAVLAIASIYYGGNVFNSGKKDGDVVRVMNEGAQIKGAAQLYTEHAGTPPTSIDDLTLNGRYLRSAPSGAWNVSAQYAISPVGTTGSAAADAAALDQCNAINKKLGYSLSAPPSCSDTAWSDKQVCCQTP